MDGFIKLIEQAKENSTPQNKGNEKNLYNLSMKERILLLDYSMQRIIVTRNSTKHCYTT